MSSTLAFNLLREQAIELRRAGKSRRQIKEILGIGSNQTLNDALQGEPPPEWTLRPNAKDGVRAKARALRASGMAYTEIAAELGVSKSSVSLWVRDMARPPRLSYVENRKRSAEGVRRYWAKERLVREAKREVIRAAAAAQIGDLSDREILVVGAIAYWCEGAKSKSPKYGAHVAFINSDPGLIKFFLRFLTTAGVAGDQVIFRVLIHEGAGVLAAQRYWQDVTGAHPAQFRKPTLKRHKPKTIRKNTGVDYHGCLRIDVLRSADLYHRIEGWVRAAAGGRGRSSAGTRTR
jgi:transcriptional regulator with XRE-family HTH domain